MTKFRPCIDLHGGKVKQIVGGSLRDDGTNLRENFVAAEEAASFAARYRKDELSGGHIIKLGAGNDEAARDALRAWPGGMQVGGGINLENAESWLEAGASHVIVTSWLFSPQGEFLENRLKQLSRQVGSERLVLDLSCKRTTEGWSVAMNRWQTLTNLRIHHDLLDRLAEYCAEFLIHAADVEGLCQGIDKELVAELGNWRKIPITYAGGVTSEEDVKTIEEASGGSLDFTVGSALDLFGGNGLKYAELVEWNRREAS